MNDPIIAYLDNEWPAINNMIKTHVIDYSMCIQAGGHHGLYPKYLAVMFNTVLTFEPDPTNYNILKTACIEHNIIYYNYALSAYAHTVDINKWDQGNSGQKWIVKGTTIKAITIDSLNLNSCGLIQLDIERHELFAIMGAIKTIEEYHPVIILEGPETTNNACNIILDQLGYEFVGRAGFDSIFKYTSKTPTTREYRELI